MTDETHLPIPQGLSQGGANQVATTAGAQLPQFRERHTIIEKKQIDREALSDIGRHLLSVRLTVPRAGAFDLAALPIDGASDPSEIDLRLLPSLFSRLRNIFNIIIIDCPPVMTGASYVSASGLADSCLLVVEAGRTRI